MVKIVGLSGSSMTSTFIAPSVEVTRRMSSVRPTQAGTWSISL
jgi:hypothetical protein